jgi:hypothetical protein
MCFEVRSLRICVIAACILVSNLAVAADDDGSGYKIQLSDWSYSRQRKTITSSNRVTGNFCVKNTGKDDLKDVTLTLRFATAAGEKAAEPATKKVGDVKAGQIVKTELVADFVPAFEAYEVTVSYAGGGKEPWYSSSDVGQPQPKPLELAKGVSNLLMLGREGDVDKSAQFKGSVRVKNQGTAEATGVKVQLSFFDKNQKNIGDFSSVLGTGKIAGGAELNIPITIANCPRTYTRFNIKLISDDTQAAGFSGAEDVEFAKFSFKREKGDVKVAAQVRNGFNVPVKGIKLTLSFANAAKKEVKSFTYDYPDELGAGETKPVAFSVPGLPLFESYEQKIVYEKCDGGAAAAQDAASSETAKDTKIESAKFKEIADVEVIFTGASTDPDKTVVLIGALRNGRATPVKDVTINVTFTMPAGDPMTGNKTLSDIIQPGEQRNFVLKAPNAAGYKAYNYRFTEEAVK